MLNNKKVSYVVQGGYPVDGRISCMGAKNLATKAIIAAVLSDEVTYLHNVPRIGDVYITQEMLTSIGGSFVWLDHSTLKIDPKKIDHHVVSVDDSRRNRIPILLLSILLHKLHRAEVPVVGGDDIGKRNVDFHIDALSKFGARVKKDGSKYYAESDGKLTACHIDLQYPSVGATETCIFLGVLAKGTSVITNIAIEPEIQELITMLRSMGAIIFLESDRKLVIHGVDRLGGASIHLIGDRIEAASWAVLACASNGSIEVEGIRPDLLGNFLSYYVLCGGGYKLVQDDTILFYREKKELRPVIIETNVYPGFSTDWQQPLCTMLTQAHGMSVVHETVYEQRFGYLSVLNKLGANAQVVNYCLGSVKCRYHGLDYPHSALIQGPTPLRAAVEPIDIPDIRAGLAYFIAAILANGATTLTSVEQIERGYGNLIEKLSDTNVNIKRI